MEDQRQTPIKKELRGLYRNVHISVKALDAIIIACILVIVVVVALNLRDPGYSVHFDSRGGTDVAVQKHGYGEPLTPMEPPTREGYVFTGWYKDAACTDPWDMAADTVVWETTLYAGWERKP